ncbi:hypothetical protein CEUSTIGMA_g13006.t1 [Chlamydomonas eustigma]|uniref:Uncharacterized protein n=1 Tax=Chlamydomonas eustigma TaxID=1157962 RepID=A0A250XR80_9CHLO|nr:hypothetical protein CEUSTIGMA_g13006.t1 [Chlamydomonas eustigma]|eukprot:GAX85591.1 hypothetical protein CEUSTIGMA_g13006.t1 [Chlamydomonas eustigma]
MGLNGMKTEVGPMQQGLERLRSNLRSAQSESMKPALIQQHIPYSNVLTISTSATVTPNNQHLPNLSEECPVDIGYPGEDMNPFAPQDASHVAKSEAQTASQTHLKIRSQQGPTGKSGVSINRNHDMNSQVHMSRASNAVSIKVKPKAKMPSFLKEHAKAIKAANQPQPAGLVSEVLNDGANRMQKATLLQSEECYDSSNPFAEPRHLGTNAMLMRQQRQPKPQREREHATIVGGNGEDKSTSQTTGYNPFAPDIYQEKINRKAADSHIQVSSSGTIIPPRGQIHSLPSKNSRMNMPTKALPSQPAPTRFYQNLPITTQDPPPNSDPDSPPGSALHLPVKPASCLSPGFPESVILAPSAQLPGWISHSTAECTAQQPSDSHLSSRQSISPSLLSPLEPLEPVGILIREVGAGKEMKCSTLTELSFYDVGVKQVDQCSPSQESPPSLLQHSSEGGAGPTTSNHMMQLPQHRSISVPGGASGTGPHILPTRSGGVAGKSQGEAGQKVHKQGVMQLVRPQPSAVDYLHPSIYDSGSPDLALTTRTAPPTSPPKLDDSNPFATSNYLAIKSKLPG